MTGALKVEQNDSIWTFVLSRPEKMNALSSELVEALLDGVADAHARGARLLVFKGEGKNFSAGFDFGNLDESSDGDLLLRFVRVEGLLHLVANSPAQPLRLPKVATSGPASTCSVSADGATAQAPPPSGCRA